MGVFSDRQKFALWTAFLGLLLPTTTYVSAATTGFVVLATQANSRMIPGVCKDSTQSACSLIAGDWNQKDYTCSNTEITKAALQSATDSILTKPYIATDVIPAIATQNCKGSGTIYSVDHGLWLLYYSISALCNCSGNSVPICTSATELSDKACNIASYNLCALVSKEDLTVACVAEAS